MRRLAILVLLAALVLAARVTPAGANAYGQLIPAGPLRGGNNLFSLDLLLGDRVDNAGLLGQARFKHSDKMDWGLQLGFSDIGSGAVMIGGDLRPLLTSSSGDMPLDVSADAAVGLEIGDHFSLFELVPAIEASHRFALSGTSQALTPYGGIGLDINHTSTDLGPDDTNVDVVARLGLEWEVAPKLGVIGELGFGTPANDLILGVNVPF
jgi:hypothetical protein